MKKIDPKIHISLTSHDFSKCDCFFFELKPLAKGCTKKENLELNHRRICFVITSIYGAVSAFFGIHSIFVFFWDDSIFSPLLTVRIFFCRTCLFSDRAYFLVCFDRRLRSKLKNGPRLTTRVGLQGQYELEDCGEKPVLNSPCLNDT